MLHLHHVIITVISRWHVTFYTELFFFFVNQHQKGLWLEPVQHCSNFQYFLWRMKQFVLLFSHTQMEPVNNSLFHSVRLVIPCSLFDLLLGYLEMLLNWFKRVLYLWWQIADVFKCCWFSMCKKNNKVQMKCVCPFWAAFPAFSLRINLNNLYIWFLFC